MIRQITRSLSARLLAIFLITSIVYAFASRFTIDLVLDRDYLREMIGAHISLHTNYFISDLGIPPDIERAQEIVDSNPIELMLSPIGATPPSTSSHTHTPTNTPYSASPIHCASRICMT